MYSDYVKKSRFFRLAEKVETSMDGVGLENAAYVAIRKSVKSSDWYRNITDSYRESVDFLLSTDHNIRLANVRTRPLGGAATASPSSPRAGPRPPTTSGPRSTTRSRWACAASP